MLYRKQMEEVLMQNITFIKRTIYLLDSSATLGL